MGIETTAWALGGRACLRPQAGYRPEAQRANVYTCPVGPAFGRGWVLMRRRDLEAMKKKGELDGPLTLDVSSGKKALHFPRLYFVKGVNVSGGPKNSRDAAYLCELVDVRYVLACATFDYSFNVVKQIGGEDFDEAAASNGSQSGAADAGGPSRYLLDTLGFQPGAGKTAWSWSEMLSFIWPTTDPRHPGFVLSAAGTHKLVVSYAAPALPFEPAGVPENYIYHRANAWKAYNDLLAKFSWALAYNPVADDFSIVEMGAVQPGLVAQEKKLVPRYDADPIEPNRSLGPSFYFASSPMQVRHHGLESLDEWRTAGGSGRLSENPSDAPDDEEWNTPLFSVRGKQRMWDIRRTAEQLWDNGPVPYETYPSQDASRSRAERLAAERVRQAVDGRILDLALPLARRVYSGIVPTFLPGSRVKCMRWQQTEADGVVTEVIQHPGLPKMGADGEWLGGGDVVRVDGVPDIPGCGSPVHPPVTYLFGLADTRWLTTPNRLPGDGSASAGWHRSWNNSGYFFGQFAIHDPLLGYECYDGGNDTNQGDRRYFNASGLAPFASRGSWDGVGSIPYHRYQYCWVRFLDCPRAPVFVRDSGYLSLSGYASIGRLNGTHTIDGRTLPLLLARNDCVNAWGTFINPSAVIPGEGVANVLLGGGGGVAIHADGWHLPSGIVARYKAGDRVFVSRVGCSWILVSGAMPGICEDEQGNLVQMCVGEPGAGDLGGNEDEWEGVVVGEDGEVVLEAGDGTDPLGNFGGGGLEDEGGGEEIPPP